MKKYYLKLAAAALCLSWSLSGMAYDYKDCNDKLVVEDFQIKPGDTKVVDVLIESSIPWTTLEADVLLPDGLELVLPENGDIDQAEYVYNYGDFMALSTNFWDKSLISGPDAEQFKEGRKNYSCAVNPDCPKANASISILIWAERPGFLIMGNGTYSLGQLKLKATDKFVGGEMVLCPDGLWLVSYSTKEYFTGSPSDAEVGYMGEPYRVKVVLPPVGIEDVKAADASEGRTYDLQGRPVTGTPAPGIYVKQGKKVVVE